MGKKQDSSRITIANIVAMVGIVLLLVFSFIGHSYLSGGELGWDVMISVGITAFTAFLLWFLIKAKGAENQLDKWKIIEYVTLGVYILFAIPASLLGGVMHFFVINDNKDDIKKYAKADIQKINQLISDYREFESEAITQTLTGLGNAVGINQRVDISLSQFMEAEQIASTKESVENFGTIQHTKLIGANFETYHTNVKKLEQEIINAVDGWSIMQMPSKARMIEELATSVENELTKKSHDAKLPIIEYSNGKYTIKETNQCRDFYISGGTDSFQFKNALQSTTGFSVTAILVVLLIHLLILFNYIVAYRTSSLGIGKYCEEDGGIILK